MPLGCSEVLANSHALLRPSATTGAIPFVAMEKSTTTPERKRQLGIVAVALLALSVFAFWPVGDPVQTTAGERVDPLSAYNPVLAGESLPADFRQILPRDAIRPVYDPTFAPADEVGWPDSTDVIGVEINGEAKAYPVDHLNGRELVVDQLGGEPILVSW